LYLSYLNLDSEDHSSRPAQAKIHEALISKIFKAKCMEDVAQVAEYLLCKYKVLNSNQFSPQNKDTCMITHTNKNVKK
jgi:hypothetical protein